MSQIPLTPVIRGHLDRFQPGPDNVGELRGWIFREDTPIDNIDIKLQGKPWVSSLSLYERPDVRAAFETGIESPSHISHCGFDIIAPLPQGIDANSKTILEITPVTAQNLRLDPLQIYCWFYPDEIEKIAKPPIHLRHRIGEGEDFIGAGAQLVSLILTYIGKFKPLHQCETILDWGCGCGRVIAQLAQFVPPGRLYGIDIDSEAIEWDKQNIPGPHFTRIDPYPPTPYPDAAFDLIYGISVMTHLDEETQFRWLYELQRISRPGAIIALTVIGRNLRAQRMPASAGQEFIQKGFSSFIPDYSDSLKEFSHQEYYKEAYHSIEYISKNWGRYFHVLEYVETKHQDMVILRKE
jgi:SAM-dependent methyltransferase